MNKQDSSVPQPEKLVYLGFDIGSVSLNTVVLDENLRVQENYYDFVHGRPFHVLKVRLEKLLESHQPETIKGIALTGTGGKLATGLIGGVLSTKSLRRQHPQALYSPKPAPSLK